MPVWYFSTACRCVTPQQPPSFSLTSLPPPLSKAKSHDSWAAVHACSLQYWLLSGKCERSVLEIKKKGQWRNSVTHGAGMRKNQSPINSLFCFVMSSMKQPTARTEMSRFNISPEEDSSSTNSNEYTYQDCPKKVPLGGWDWKNKSKTTKK